MNDDDALTQLSSPTPSLGVGLWAAMVYGPKGALPVVLQRRPFGGELVRWLQRLAREPKAEPDPVEPEERPARRLLRTLRDARSGTAGTMDRVLDCLEEAETLDDPLAVGLIATMGADEAASFGRFEESGRLASVAMRSSQDPRVQALALSSQANVAVQRGLPKVARPLSASAVDRVGRGTFAAGIVRMRAVVVAHYTGDDCIRILEAAVQDFSDSGAHHMVDRARLYLALVTLAPGRFQEAIVLARQVSLAEPQQEFYGRAIEGCALLGMGRVRLALETLNSAVSGLSPGDQMRWVAAAGALAAAHLTGSSAVGAQLMADALADPLPEDAPGTATLLRLAHRWTQGHASARMWERARVTDDAELMCFSAGYRADRAFRDGAFGEALQWLDEADKAAERGRFLHRVLRNRWARLRIAAVRGQDCAQALESTIAAFIEHGDVFGEARACALLAEVVLPCNPAQAASLLRRATSLADTFGWTFGTGRWRWLLALSGETAPQTAETVEERFFLAVRQVQDSGDSLPAAVAALDRARAALPDSGRRHHIERLGSAVLQPRGLRWHAEGERTLVLLPSTREVWLGGQRLAAMGRARIQFRLLEAILSRAFPTREALFAHVWEQPYRPPSSDNTLHVALGRLRGRLGDQVRVQVDERGDVTVCPPVGILTAASAHPAPKLRASARTPA